ncbi:MAG: hypothetical protein GX593_11650 [Actinomycetales bacterium]|nr:hypothetical protein [Actinomycetales bacterium]
MRTVIEAAVILGAVALATFAGYGLAVASAELGGGVDGWDGVIAVLAAGITAFVALVSSTLATLVVRKRGWRLAYVILTLVGVVYLALGAFTSGRSAGTVLSEVAVVLSLVLALWVPVGARWWIERRAHEEEEPEREVSGRSAALAASLCGAVVLVTVGIVLAVAGSTLPSGLAGFALVLVVAAAMASGRVPEVMALALLAGVGICAVLFGLTMLPDGGLVVGALAVVVLVAFSWRPLAARLTKARSAAMTLAVPAAGRPAPEDADVED